MLKKMEPLQQIHELWMKQTEHSSIFWELVRDDRYSGPYGFPKGGPLSKVQDAVWKINSIVDIFLFVFPMSLSSYIADQTRYFAYEDWV